MAINVHEVASLHGYEEPNGSYGIDASGSFGSFTAMPFRRDDGLDIDIEQLMEPTEHARQHQDAYSRKQLGVTRAKGTLSLNLSTFTTRAGSAVAAVQGPLGMMLKIVMGGESLNTGTTVTGSSSTASTIDCTSAAGISVGSAIGLINPTTGLMEVREVASKSGGGSNTVNVKLAFSFIPAASDAVYASATYYLGGTLGSQTTSLQLAARRINALDRNLLLGGYLSDGMKITTKRGALARIAFGLTFAKWLESATAAGDFSNDGALTPLTYLNTLPHIEMDSAFYQQTVGTATYSASTSKVKAQEIEWNPDIKYTVHSVPGGVNNIEQPLRDANSPVLRGAFVVPYEDNTWRAAQANDTVKAFTHQIGSSATRGAILLSAPRCQVDMCKMVNQDGIRSQRVEYCVDVDQATTPNVSDLALSAFRIHLL